jgi:putative membrane protein
MQLIVRLLITGIAVFVASYILPGVQVDSFVTALIVAIVLGVINAFIKPILMILTLPITLVTLGLFTFVINALLVLLTDYVVPGFSVDNFFWALGFSIVVLMVCGFVYRRAAPAT